MTGINALLFFCNLGFISLAVPYNTAYSHTCKEVMPKSLPSDPQGTPLMPSHSSTAAELVQFLWRKYDAIINIQ